MENVDKKNIGLPSRYINALYELCDEAKNLKKITQDFEKFIKLVEDNKDLNNILFSPTVGKTNQGKILNDILKKGKADKLTVNFCGVLCRNGRVNLITKIMREFLNEVANEIAKDPEQNKYLSPVAAKHIETLQRSNEQLVKIIALTQKNKSQSMSLTEEDKNNLFDMIQEEKKH